jgi:hypothetical protein
MEISAGGEVAGSRVGMGIVVAVAIVADTLCLVAVAHRDLAERVGLGRDSEVYCEVEYEAEVQTCILARI